MRRSLLAILGLLASCDSAHATPPTKPPTPNPTTRAPDGGSGGKRTMTTPAKLEWNMSLIGGKLHVDYQVWNKSSARIYVCDDLLVPVPRQTKFVRAPGRLIVMNGESPGTVSLTCGAISADQPLMVIYEPTFRAVEPGQSLKKQVELPLPLTAWHNLGRAEPLRGTPTTAQLTVHYFTGEPEWKTLPSDEAKPLLVPKTYEAQFASGSLPIPASYAN